MRISTIYLGATATLTATAAALALMLLLGLSARLASAAAVRDMDADMDADTLPAQWLSRRLSPRAAAASDEPAAAAAVVATTATVQQTATATDTATDTTTDTATDTATTSFASPSCDLLYCDNGTSYCVYWGGYSSYDYSQHHPVPGETRTAIGTCRRISTTSNSYSAITGSPSPTAQR